jgi:superfamily II DNA or RNA helicase
MPSVPTLRPYQLRDLDRIGRSYNDGSHAVLYTAPTGSGKTVVGMQAIHHIDGRIFVLVHRDEILEQTSRALAALSVPHGVIAPGYDAGSERVQVCSVMTLVRRLDWMRRRPPELLIIDEAHHAQAATWKHIIAAAPDAGLLGLTATPRRLDGKPLDDIFDTLIIGPTIAQLIDDGWLAPVNVFTPVRDPDLSRVQVRAGDYAVEQLSQVMSGGIIISGAVNEYERLCPEAPAIVFAVDIAHSKLVADAFANRGYRAEHVDGETPRRERRELIAALDNRDIDILCNCGLISEGLDVPGVEAAILLRPTRSLALYLQMVGRALRPGKPLAYVLDHAGNVYRHGLPTARRYWTLHGKQQVADDPASSLVRCPECGAMNQRDADYCVHCGAELHRHQRAPHVEVAAKPLVEALERPVSDDDLGEMGYRAALQWASDIDGRLIGKRCERIEAARGYKQGWAYYVTGKRWDQVWEEAVRWRKQQQQREQT